ncbi:MAG: site-2 protease family protein [Synechococcaceae cyanobacterium]|nr:site-2 protease family protein [Synechococcaceae cyanobacterium]
MGEGWQLLKIRGIPLRIHPSWFVILGVATVAFSQHYRLAISPPLSPPQLYGIALLTALLLFVSVLLHELGHSLVALSQGVQVRSITLFLLGGVASVERECTTAIGALLVAAAGPAVSLVLAVALLLGIHPASHVSPLLGEMVQQLGLLNLVLALFNLLPGLPLDGGLIVKALVWQLTGSQRRGIEVANASGRALAFLAIGLGSLLLLRGSGLGGVWLILLGWFGLGASRNQQQLLLVQQALRELKVREAAQRRFRVLESDMTLRDLSRLRLDDGNSAGAEAGRPEATAASPPDWLLVCERGRWRGVIDDAPLRELPVQHWDREPIGRHLQPLDSLPMIREDAPLWQAVLALDEPGISRLLVLNPAGLPNGTVERPEIGEAVLRRLGLRIPAPLLSSARRQGTYPLGLALAQVTRSMLNSGEVTQPTSGPAPTSGRS